MHSNMITEEFIQKAKAVHGNKYDYSKVEYVNNKTKVCIICPIHGEFWQRPHDHTRHAGCPVCSHDRGAKLQAISDAEFIKKAKAVHGDKYDYSKVKYINNRIKVLIICPIHDFEQKPSNHLQGQGCPFCGREKNRASRTYSFEDFIKAAKAVHGDKYDYSKVNYINKNTKVCIICPKHGEFWQIPHKHLSGQGCEKCFRASLAKRYSLGQEKFIERASEVHHGFYDYSQVDYVNSSTYINIICPLHGVFPQLPSSHLRGHGCPKCADIENGKRKRKWTSETCRKEAQKYKTKVEFQKGYPGAYLYAQKHRLLETFDWFEELKKPNGYWTRERCEEESRKYHSKKEFLRGCAAAHQAAVRNGWLDEFTWLVNQRIDVVKDKIDSVYVYLFEDAKAAYVGRTLIKRQRKRDREHIFNQDSDAVARYAKKLNMPVPPMTILESNLTLEEGQAREDYWRKWYEKHGYTMLNRIATGIGKGSLGAIGQGKWNRRTCREEALKYKTATEFEKNSSGAYAAALRNDWLKEYTWFAVLKHEWDKQTCYNEARKYHSRGEFQKGCNGAYIKALKTGWIEEYTWLKSRQKVPAGYWDNYEHCYEEAKKYKKRRHFMRGCMGAYSKALKNGWLDDYTWFDEKAKQNYWNRETCMEEAKKYQSRAEFQRQAMGAYLYALKEGWLNDYTWFKQLTGFWTYEACKAEASKYETRGQFAKGSRSAYTKARIKGWLDEFFPK